MAKVKSAGKILAEGFLEFIPYVTPVDDLGLRRYCRACRFFGVAGTPAIWYFKRNGKSKSVSFYETEYYCKEHAWEAITQTSERNRYRKWIGKYAEALAKELEQPPYSAYRKKENADTD